MGKASSLEFLQELENLEKGTDTLKNCLTTLKSRIHKLDYEAIPFFLTHFTRKKEISPSYMECFMSLIEVLSRVHGRNIVQHIDTIMTIIIRALSLKECSVALHQSSSKVISALARFGIDTSTPDIEKKRIIFLLSKPLSDYLTHKEEIAASGAALCLSALVESENWRFCSSEMVNEVCLKAAVALEEKQSQTCSHIGLVMCLTKNNTFTADAYSRSFIRSGLQILTADSKESDSMRRSLAAQMINFLLMHVDYGSIASELANVIGLLEKCEYDHMQPVRVAAFEALQTAYRLSSEKEARHSVSSSPCTGTNYEIGKNGSTSPLCFEEHGNARGNKYPVFTYSESNFTEPSLDYNTCFDSSQSLGLSSQICDCSSQSKMQTLEMALKNDFFLASECKIADVAVHSDNICEINESYKENSVQSKKVDRHGAACVLQKDIDVSPQELLKSSQSSDNWDAKVVETEGCNMLECKNLFDKMPAWPAGTCSVEDLSYNLISEIRERNDSLTTSKKNKQLIQEVEHTIDTTEVITCAYSAREKDDGKALPGAILEDTAPFNSKKQVKCDKYYVRCFCCLFFVLLAVVLMSWQVGDDNVVELVPT